TIEIDTPVGTKLPIRYGADGKLAGEARDLAWYLGAATDRGRWWVEGGQLCHKWNSWFSSEPQCLRLRKEGRVIRWRKEDGNSGPAMVTVPPVKLAMASLLGAPPSRSKEVAPPEASSAPVKAPDKVPEKQPDGATVTKEALAKDGPEG